MRYKIMYTSATTKHTSVWSLGYPTKTSALAAARRLNNQGASHYFIKPMTADDEALAAGLEVEQ